jgi:hypothetical protein
MSRTVKPCFIGERYNYLVVIDAGSPSDDGRFRHLCRCDCGKIIPVKPSELRSRRYISCGCVDLQRCRTFRLRHGHWAGRKPTPEWNAWNHMLQRCSNPKDCKYEHYGGRGIRVCKRWKDSFEAFLADLGPRPPGQLLDRIDPNGHYEPANCRWATKSESNKNRRPFVRTSQKYDMSSNNITLY